ncbi:MAG: hypothetical protein COA63_014205 [Methylophaga sp.]|nr:hypothetical protein [Methylophaga sp.]
MERNHYSIAALTVYYKRKDETVKQRNINFMIVRPKKNICKPVLEEVTIAVTQQAYDQLNIQPDELKEICFNSISYLGLMTDKEFNEG